MQRPDAEAPSPKVRLFTSSYLERDSIRQTEFDVCLQRNLGCVAIDEVCVLAEGTAALLPRHEKLRVREIPERPSFDDFFAWIRDVSDPDDLAVVANADIWFDTSLLAVKRHLKRGECFVLARWDGDTIFDRNDSQDCWVFRGTADGVFGKFPLGVARCDNRLLHELQVAGLHVRNPSYSVKAHHLHAGKMRVYAENEPHFVESPYRYVWPGNLLGPVRTFFHNRVHPEEHIGWRVDWRRIRRTPPFSILARAFAQLSATLRGGRTSAV